MNLCPHAHGSTPSTLVLATSLFCLATLKSQDSWSVWWPTHPICCSRGWGRGKLSVNCRAPGSLEEAEPVACVASEQLHSIPQGARLREGSAFNCAGPGKAGMLDEQHREGARLGFPELEPREAGFPTAAGSKFNKQKSPRP